NRTALSDGESDDLEMWSAAQFYKTIAHHFEASLQPTALLKNTKLNSILPVLKFGTNTQDLRKTVFELLAFRAVDFFSNTEKMTVRPAYEFSLNDEKFYWPAEKFSQMKLVSSDSTHMHFYTVKLFQELLKMNADDVSARIDADLIRLK